MREGEKKLFASSTTLSCLLDFYAPLPPHPLLYYSRLQVDNKDKVSIFCTTYNCLPFSGVSFCFVFLLLLFSFLKGGELDKCLQMIIKLQGSF